MKVIALFFILLMTFGLSLHAQTPEWIWASQAGGTWDEHPTEIALDDSGNCYVTGDFSETANFGSYSLTSSEDEAIFVAKMDADGNWLWAVQAGGSIYDIGSDITTDSNGNIYVTGKFSGTTSFGSTTLTSIGTYDIFVAKLDTEGNWIWAIQAGGEYTSGRGIAFDNSGYGYVTGLFWGSATFGSYSFTSIGMCDIFVAKLDTDGNWIWVYQAGGTEFISTNEITIDDNGNSYVSGVFQGLATFGTTSLTSNGGNDIFIAKLDTNGNWLWASKAGGSEADACNNIAIDNYGNSYVTGTYIDSATFGSYSLSGNELNNIYAAKLDANGNWLWATRAVGQGSEISNGIVVDDYGNSYITGYFNDLVFFDPYLFISNGNYDIFVANLDTNGNWLWAIQVGGSSDEISNEIAIDDLGNIYIAGRFFSTITFGTTTIIASDFYDIFVAKYGIDYKSDFSVDINSGYAPLLLNFTDLSLLPFPIIDWSWDFGDGNTSTLQNPSNEYLLPGIYSVSLTVVDSNSFSDSETKVSYITVYSSDPPASPPDVQVNIIHPDAVISWVAVDTTLSGDPCITDGYIVLYNETAYEDEQYYYFLDYTTELNYTHTYVAQHREQMFYKVVSFVDLGSEEIQYLNRLNGNSKLRWLDVKERLESINSTK